MAAWAIMKSRGSFVGKGHYVNHHEPNEHPKKMRLELNLQSTAVMGSKMKSCMQIRIRENTSMHSGGVETGITLTIEQAKELTDILLDAIHYVIPAREKRFPKHS